MVEGASDANHRFPPEPLQSGRHLIRRAHSYGLPKGYRETVAIVLAVFAIFASWSIHWGLTTANVSVHWMVGAPSVFAIYAVLRGVFNRFVWALSPVRPLLLRGMPNLTGDWTGIIKSSYDNFAEEYPIELTVKQTWSKIGLFTKADRSNGASLSASFDRGDDGVWILQYTFANQPIAEAPRRMAPHHGTSMLVVTSEGLDGDYYSGRERRTYGAVRLTRKA